MERRLFYQVYCDGKEIFDIFEIDNNAIHQTNALERVYGAIFNCLAIRGIKEFREDGKQYIIMLNGDVEVKVTRYKNWTASPWLQVSAKDFDTAKAVFEDLVKYVQERMRILKEAEL